MFCDCKNAGSEDGYGEGNNDHHGDDEDIYGVALQDDERELRESDLEFEDDDDDLRYHSVWLSGLKACS